MIYAVSVGLLASAYVWAKASMVYDVIKGGHNKKCACASLVEVTGGLGMIACCLLLLKAMR